MSAVGFSDKSVRLLAVSEKETEAHLWMGLLRDRDVSLRSDWANSTNAALDKLSSETYHLLVCNIPPTEALLSMASKQRCTAIIYCDATTHQTATWLEAGAECVLPKAQIATLAPLVIRTLQRARQLHEARMASTIKNELEQRIGLLQHRLDTGVMYFEQGRVLHVSGYFGDLLNGSGEHHVGDNIKTLFPDDLLSALGGFDSDWIEWRGHELRVESSTLLGRPCQLLLRRAAGQQLEVIREVEVIKEVPVEVQVIKEVEVIKEVPVPQNSSTVEVIKQIEKPVEVIKEVVKEVPVEVVKEVIREVPVEVIKEVIREVPAPTGNDGFGLERILKSLRAYFEKGEVQTLAVVELQKAALVRHSMTLVSFAELMGTFQARLGDAVDVAPEPLTDHSFILASLESPATLSKKLEAFFDELAKPLVPDAPRLTACAGLIASNELDLDAEGLLQHCYDLVGEADSGRALVFTPSTAEMALKDPLTALQSALDKNQCELLYQPLVALSAVDGEHYEVLTQLLDDNGKVLPARTFIRDAGRHEVGQLLDRFVVSQAIEQLLGHLPRNPDTKLIVNLTLASLQSTDLVHWLQSAALSIASKGNLIFQFRETDLAVDVQTSALHLKSLKSLGFGVAIGQFGNLSNPLKLLNDLQADWVKVDPSFIEGLKDNADKQTELKRLSDGIKGAGARVICPMVENPAILSLLYRVGSDLVQGHYLQPPAQAMDYEFTMEI